MTRTSPARPTGERFPLGRGESAQQLLVVGSQVFAQPVGDGAAVVGELEPVDPTVGRLPLPDDPSPALQGGRQPAHRALLQTEEPAQLMLRHRLDLAQLPHGHHL